MTNMFWDKFKQDMTRGYGEPTNNYNQNANHQVSNNSNSYNSWSNNWETQKQNNTSFTWDYFDDSLKQQKQIKRNPAKEFNPTNFINENFMDPLDYRADGNKTHKWDTNKINTNYKKTSYSTSEGFKTLANGVPYNDKNMKLENNQYKYYDSETNKYYPVYALGMNQLKEYSNHKNKNLGVWDNSIYGSLINIYHEDGSVTDGIVMDCSSAGNKSAIIDEWNANVNPNNEYVSWEFKRIGWGNTPNPKR